MGVATTGFVHDTPSLFTHILYYQRAYIAKCCNIHIVLRRSTFLHILPTLINIQRDDQLYRTGNFIPFCVAVYNGTYNSISSLSDMFDESPFPQMTWTDVFLYQGRVSSPKFGRCLLVPDFMETPLTLQKSSASFCRILNSFVGLPFGYSSGPDGIAISLPNEEVYSV